MNSDVLLFFHSHPQALPLYAQLEEQILSRLPETTVKVSKTQITFANRHGFAFVSFNPCRRAKDRPPVWMTVSFGLGRRCPSPRIDAATEPYPGRWTHHLLVSTPEDIDQELLTWLEEAAAFAAAKRR